MDANASTWDKWAPAAFFFVIGLVLGYVAGVGIGAAGSSPSLPLLISIPPVAIIVAAFILFNLAARRRDKPS
ncbi:MAG TPA: hypothetical protein VMB46_08915 [Methanomassiliicoccales archaeon]|nr:hypothetical protein [Methanomassiliicoccales archaeon]